MNYLLHYSLKQFITQRRMPLGVVHMSRGQEAKKKFHNHNYSEIVLILDGSGTHYLESEHFPIKAGDVLIIHQNINHAYDPQDLELVNIIYDPQQLMLPILDGASMPLFRKFFPDSHSDFHGQVEPILSLAPEDMKNVFEKVKLIRTELKACRSGCNLRSLALFIEVIVELCRLYKNDSVEETSLTRIGDALEYMNTHYKQPIAIDALAKKACMSRRNFFIHFKNTAGCTPLQYLTLIRINRATELLLYTEMQISDIAVRCGFSDSNYFCRTFHNQTGESPQQYRLKYRN